MGVMAVFKAIKLGRFIIKKINRAYYKKLETTLLEVKKLVKGMNPHGQPNECEARIVRVLDLINEAMPVHDESDPFNTDDAS